MRPTPLHLLPLVGALALCACRDTKPPAEADAGPAAPSKSAPAPTDRRDPGPRLERPLGEKKAVERPAVSLEVDAVETIGGAVYLRALMPPDPSRVVVGPLDGARLHVLGDRPGLAVPAAQGRLPERPWLYVRLDGEAPPPDPLVVRWRQAALLDGEPGQIQDMTLVGASLAEPFPRLAPRIFEAMDRWFVGARLHPPTAFGAFASGRMALLSRPDARPGSGAVEPIELMRLYTDPLAPLLMRDLGQRGIGQAEASVPLAAVEAPDPSGYPWETLAPSTPAAPEPLARWAPAEWLYVQLSGLEAALALHDEVHGLFGPLLAAYEVSPGDRRLLARRLAELDLDRQAIAELAPAVGRAALLLTDPMLREGPGMVLVLEARDPAAIQAVLDARERAAKAGGADVDRVTLDRRSFTRIRGPQVRAHRALVEDVLLVANSPAALERVLAARSGRAAMAASHAFAVMRGRLPPSEAEVAFAVAGPGLLDRLDGPRLRVLAARRTRALAALRAATLAGLLHGWLSGRPFDPASGLDAARAGGLWGEADEALFEGGMSFAGGRACAAPWGCADLGTPLIDLPLDAVTEAEAGAYRRLRTEEIDRGRSDRAPLAVRVERRGSGYAVSAQMLPLGRHHGWRALTRLFGEGRVGPAGGDGLEVRLAVAADAPLRARAEAWLSATTGQRAVGLSWMGDHVVVGLGPRSGVWDAVLNVLELPNLEGRRRWRDPEQRKGVLDRLPLYLLVPVADRPALDAALVAASVFAGAPGSPIGWTAAGTYRGVAVTEVREVLTEVDGGRVGLFLGVAGEALVIGVERATFEAAVDRALDGGDAAPAAEAGPQASARLVLAPGGWMQRAVSGALERFAIRRLEPARRAFEAAARGSTLPPPGPAQDAALLGLLGFVPEGPHGDRPRLLEDGAVSLPRYGSAVAPKWPAVPAPDSPLTGLATVDARLGFEGPAGRQALVVELSWTRR